MAKYFVDYPASLSPELYFVLHIKVANLELVFTDARTF